MVGPVPTEPAAKPAVQARDQGQAVPGHGEEDAPPAPTVPGWALAVAALACAGMLLGMLQAFADSHCALKMGPTGYPYAYRLGHGCFVQIDGVWASETDWVQTADGTWQQASELRRPQKD